MKKKTLSKNAASNSSSKSTKAPLGKAKGASDKKSAMKSSAKSLQQKTVAKPGRKPEAKTSKTAGKISKTQPKQTQQVGSKKKLEDGSSSVATKKASSPLKSAVKVLGKAGQKLVDKVTKPLAKLSTSGSGPKKEIPRAVAGEDKTKKITPTPLAASLDVKKKTQADHKPPAPVKKTSPKKGKAAKKEKDEAVDDFVDTDDLLGGESEIAEYEEELQAVEELDEEEGDEDAEFSLEGSSEDENEVILTDAEGRRYCRVKDCDQIAMVDGYCRYHYLLLWRKIQVRKKILADGKLEKYVEELTARYPDKFLEMIRKDLKTEKDFLSAIGELEIDESANENEFEEDAQTFIDEVRGLGEGPTSGVEDEDY